MQYVYHVNVDYWHYILISDEQLRYVSKQNMQGNHHHGRSLERKEQERHMAAIPECIYNGRTQINNEKSTWQCIILAV